jgi:hypothetical protein
LAQIVRLEQHYESDPIILGLCGERAQLVQKYGINQITDDMLEQEITVRVSVGLGAGDPQMRLQKFAMATQIAMPLLQASPQFQSGAFQLDAEAIMQEIFGTAGYRDGGMRFIKKGEAQPDPNADLEAQKTKSEIEKNQQTGKSALMNALAALAKVNLGEKELEADMAMGMIDKEIQMRDLGNRHGLEHVKRDRDSKDQEFRHESEKAKHDREEREAGHRHGVAVAGLSDSRTNRREDLERAALEQQAKEALTNGGGGGGGGNGNSALASQAAAAGGGKAKKRFNFIRDPETDRIIGIEEA